VNGSFEDYVKSCCNGAHSLLESRFYHPLTYNAVVTKSRFCQIFDEHGLCQVDLIFKLERINDAREQVFGNYLRGRCKKVKVMPHRNPTRNKKTKGYQGYYTDETRELVERYYKNDLEMFGYDFSGSLDGEIFVNPKSVTISPFSWDDLVSGIYPLKINNDYQNGGRRVLGSDGRIIVLDTSRHPQTQWGNSPTDKLIENSQMGISLYPDKFKKKKISNTNAAYRARPDSKPISSPGPNYRWDGRKWVVAQRSSSQPPSKSKRGNPNPATMDRKSVEGVNCPNPATMDRKSVEGVNCGMPRKEQRSQNSIRKKSSKQLVNGFTSRHKKSERYRTVNGRKIKV
jgi:hypothetical protein